MLAERADHLIGVDTHKLTHTAAAVRSATGEAGAPLTVAAELAGYAVLLDYAEEHATGSRAWAIESSGSYGAGLCSFLLERGESVYEVDRPKRPRNRSGAKSDEVDAVRAARELLGRAHLSQPRRGGRRAAIRVLLRTRESAVLARTQAINQLKALIVAAPEELRSGLRPLKGKRLLEHCSRLRRSEAHSVETRATISALRACARRALALGDEAAELGSELAELVSETAPELLAEPGIGPISAAELLNAFSHPGRIRSEAAFAMIAGAAPVAASSGQTVRFRLNHGGDRRLNRALNAIVISRLAHHEETRAYAERRLAEGKSSREIRRCLKRYLARRVFRLMEATVEPL